MASQDKSKWPFSCGTIHLKVSVVCFGMNETLTSFFKVYNKDGGSSTTNQRHNLQVKIVGDVVGQSVI